MSKTTATPSSKSSPKKCKGTCGMRRVLNGEDLCSKCAPVLGTLPAPRETPATPSVEPTQAVAEAVPVCSAENPLGCKGPLVEAAAKAAGIEVVEIAQAPLTPEDLAGVPFLDAGGPPQVTVVFAHVSRFPGQSGNARQRRKIRREGYRG